MFDVTSFETIVGATLALVSLVLLFALNGYRNEKGDAEYLRDRLDDARDEVSGAERALVEADELMSEAATLIQAFIGELDEVDEMLDAAEEEAVDLQDEVDEVTANWEEAVAFSRMAIALLEIFKPLAFGERD